MNDSMLINFENLNLFSDYWTLYGVSVRLINCLNRAGVYSINDLLTRELYDESRRCMVPVACYLLDDDYSRPGFLFGFGKKTKHELLDLMEKLGYTYQGHGHFEKTGDLKDVTISGKALMTWIVKTDEHIRSLELRNAKLEKKVFSLSKLVDRYSPWR